MLEDKFGKPGNGPGEVIEVDPKVQESLWNQHSTMKSTINSGNVSNMQMNWKYATPTPVSHAPVIDANATLRQDLPCVRGGLQEVPRHQSLIVSYWKSRHSRVLPVPSLLAL